MSFLLIVVISLVALGVVAALLSRGSGDEPIVNGENNCDACSSRADCKLAELKEEVRCKKDDGRGKRGEGVLLTTTILLLISYILLLSGCSAKKNTAKSRWWQSFTARYNTYYNGSQAFIDGSLEKETGNKDNHTELLPLYTVGNKQSREIGKGNFDRAIEKSEKTIRLHSIKARPEWNKSRRKTQKDIEWLSRREYNPFLWHAWLLLGKAQFQQGAFEEAAATFSYMSRLYMTQPAILGRARAWLAKSYTELGWMYDAEDVMNKQRRDSMDYRAVKDWDYTYANYYLRNQRYAEAMPYLRKVIRHEKRRKQKAREWFIMGQLQAMAGNRQEAYKSYAHVIRLNPPYELEFNARIAQTEVMAAGNSKRMINRLRRMASSDNNKDFLDQVYYAIGNIYLAERDTTHAIEAYEEGNKKATRSGIEKGVLLLTLGNLYWQREKFGDAQRCYGEAIGLLDKDRPDYKQLSDRSKILDELVPHTNSVELQDSLQRLARMPEAERNKVIDKIIEDLIKKEKEEKRAQQEAEAEATLQKQQAVGNRQQTTPMSNPATKPGGAWYFYNPQAVSQGKTTFQQQWGKRENRDNWQRINQTVVGSLADSAGAESTDSLDLQNGKEIGDSIANAGQEAPADSSAQDPHKREYYLAQIPFTEEQMEASNAILQEALFHAGIIIKDKMDNLPLGERMLTRLTSDFKEYEHNDEAWYHLFLLYSRQGRTTEAEHCLAMLKSDFPESQWTTLLSDPYFAENQRFGVHIEDSLYAATYDAFKAERIQEVMGNAQVSEQRFPQGAHRPKFLFVEGLTLLSQGDGKGCTDRMQQVVEKFPESEVSSLAGMIIRGVQQGRRLHGGRFDMGDVWSRRMTDGAGGDSTQVDTLLFDRNTSYVFLLAYQPDSVNQNQLLYEIARYNFTNYMVRNFDIVTEQSDNGLCRMIISGFLNYDEARQYARKLYADAAPKKVVSAGPTPPDELAGLESDGTPTEVTVETTMGSLLHHCRSLIVSEANLRLLGTSYSYADYEVFFEQEIEPVEISPLPLLEEPESITQKEDPDDTPAPASADDPAGTATPANPATPQQPDPDDFFNDAPVQQKVGNDIFDDDFWR